MPSRAHEHGARDDDDLRHRADHESCRAARCPINERKENCAVADDILVAAMDEYYNDYRLM
jgi:hypothetical protein